MGVGKKPAESPVDIAHTHALLEFMNAAWTPYHAVGAHLASSQDYQHSKETFFCGEKRKVSNGGNSA